MQQTATRPSDEIVHTSDMHARGSHLSAHLLNANEDVTRNDDPYGNRRGGHRAGEHEGEAEQPEHLVPAVIDQDLLHRRRKRCESSVAVV